MKKNIAGVLFTETGIMIEKSYQQDLETKKVFKDEMFIGVFLMLAQRIIKNRMMHCRQQLHSNLANATHITPEIIAWQDGHFNVIVWQEMEKALELKDARELNTIQCQQIIRAMLLNQVGNWVYDVDMITWTKCQEGDMKISDDFKNFISEQILIGMQPVPTCE